MVVSKLTIFGGLIFFRVPGESPARNQEEIQGLKARSFVTFGGGKKHDEHRHQTGGEDSFFKDIKGKHRAGWSPYNGGDDCKGKSPGDFQGNLGLLVKDLLLTILHRKLGLGLGR